MIGMYNHRNAVRGCDCPYKMRRSNSARNARFLIFVADSLQVQSDRAQTRGGRSKEVGATDFAAEISRTALRHLDISLSVVALSARGV